MICFFGVSNAILRYSNAPITVSKWQRPKEEIDTISWLRNNIKTKDIILHVPVKYLDYHFAGVNWVDYAEGESSPIISTPIPELDFAIFGGLTTLRPDWGTAGFAFARNHLKLRQEMANYPEKFAINDFWKQGVRWIVIDESKIKDDPFSPIATKWEQDGDIKKVNSFGNYQIYNISPQLR